MISKDIDGVLVGIKDLEERCGQCNQHFKMEIYINPLSEKRSFRVICQTCNYIIPTEEENY